MASNIATKEYIQQFIKNAKGFERVFKNLKIVSADKGNCLAELKVEEEHSNVVGTMHGGLSGSLVDSVSTYALMSHERGMIPSISVDIHLSFLKAAKIGEEILIDAKTIRRGKTLAFLDVVIKNKNTGDILVKGTHTKYLMQPKVQ